MKELKFNLKYLFHRKEIYFVILIVFLVNIIHCFMTVNYCAHFADNHYIENIRSAESQFILYNIDVSLNAIIIIVLPIVCSLLFADSSFIENKNKTFNILYTRINTNKNSFVRFILSLVIPLVICFLGFMLNYLIMSLIFKNGLLGSIYQETGFYQYMHLANVLNNLRYNNLTLYIVVISLIASFTIGLLSCLSYSISKFLKHRIPIYFMPLLILIFCEFIFSNCHLGDYSLIRFLQPTTLHALSPVLIISIVIFIIGLLLEIYNIFKKDHIL